jgi:hypothetical protein
MEFKDQIIKEIQNPGNSKLIYHSAIFAAAVYLFSKFGDSLAV